MNGIDLSNQLAVIQARPHGAWYKLLPVDKKYLNPVRNAGMWHLYPYNFSPVCPKLKNERR